MYLREIILVTPVVLGLVFSGCTSEPTEANQSQTQEQVSERTPAVPTASTEGSNEITVYKSPTCGCCSLWVEHLEDHDFVVEAVDMDNVNAVKDYYGLPSDMASCHTGIIDGFVIEGHVPAEDVQRLLEERPEAIGLAVPGMPIGSPGMEVEGRPADNYDVYLVAEDGNSVFASH